MYGRSDGIQLLLRCWNRQRVTYGFVNIERQKFIAVHRRCNDTDVTFLFLCIIIGRSTENSTMVGPKEIVYFHRVICSCTRLINLRKKTQSMKTNHSLISIVIFLFVIFYFFHRHKHCFFSSAIRTKPSLLFHFKD